MWGSYCTTGNVVAAAAKLLTGGVAAVEERIKRPKSKTRVVRRVDL